MIYLKVITWFFVIGSLFSVRTAYAEYSISILIHPQYNAYSSDTLFDVPSEYIKRPGLTSEQTIELTGGFQQPFNTYSYLLSTRNKLSDDRTSKTEVKVNELFMSHGIDNWELILGRRISSWGIGYGFRPLDVIQQYDQQSTSQQSMIGKNQFAWEYFTDMSSWSLLWVNPLQTEETENNKLESFVAKFSTNRENYDQHALFRYNNDNKLQFGLGRLQLISDSLSIHGSLLLSQKYQKQLHRLAGQTTTLLSFDYPYITKDYNNGLQALAGLNWSSITKHNIIVEYWYNEMAYSPHQWKALFKLAEQQQILLEQTPITKAPIHGNIAWTANATQAQSLAQHNLMLRWNYDANYWKPTVNILLSPDDKSYMTTLLVTRAYNSFKFEAGVRMFIGANDSVYGGLIISHNVFMTFSGAY